MQPTFQLNTNTLSWAAANIGYSLTEFAHQLYKTEQTVKDISQGKLTVDQAKRFSAEAKVPFGFLFLESPPAEYLPDTNFVDFRTRTNHDPYSAGFKKTLRDVEHKQIWYRNYLVSNNADKLPFVGKFANEKNVASDQIANEIREALNIEKIKARNADEYFSELTRAAEDIGILVFKNSVVINNTKDHLDANEFDGFVITDDYAPCVFINGAASKNANIFTLAHELAHIWLGESGISDSAINSKNVSEARCNEIAARVLVPISKFIDLWQTIEATALEKIKILNTHFKVSELVIARTALSLNKINYDLYNVVKLETDKAWEAFKNKAGKGGPSPIITVSTRNSKTITNKVIELLHSNKMMPSQAAILLNKSPATVMDL